MTQQKLDRMKRTIDEVQSLIDTEYMPEAILWCDENMDNAWTNALNNFDAALVKYMKDPSSFDDVEIQRSIYLGEIRRCMAAFKTYQSMQQLPGLLQTQVKNNET